MVNKLLNYILGAISLMLLFLLLFSQCSNNKKSTEISSLRNELFACQNAPIKTDTVVKYDTIIEYKYVKPKPRPTPTDGGVSPPSPTGCGGISSVYYSDVFEKKGAKIHWEAYTECENDSAKIQEIRFPEIIVPERIITNTKTVHDTIPKEVPAKIRSKFVTYAEVTSDNFKAFPGVGLGIGYLHKQNFLLSAGGLYLNNRVYGSVRVSIVF